MNTISPATHDFMRRRNSGFTLVEILIVVVILGILASIVIPQFSNASAQARENTLKDELRYLRTQITVFAAQHRDKPPGFPDGDTSTCPSNDTAFVEQMTMFTDEACEVSNSKTSTHKYGPYLSRIPVNPINGNASILITITDMTPNSTDGHGWIYNPDTRQITANLVGTDSSGVEFSSY